MRSLKANDVRLVTYVPDRVLTPLIKKNANPVVFCRYLATAEHVRDGLRKAFPKLVVEAVTGVLTPDERRDRVAFTWHGLRQQNQRPPGKPNYCLADFVAPKSSGVGDYVGMFAVTAGLDAERKLAEFEAAKDDYSAIMLKALADRLAAAFAEWLHRKVRRERWG